MGERMAAVNPATHEQLRLRVWPFAVSAPTGSQEIGEWLFANAIAWLVLVVACANVATLMFARTAMRESEIVVRNALGASRRRVMGQLFVETLVLTSAAAVAGLTAASLVIKYLFRQAVERQIRMPFWYDDRMEPVTVLYTAVLAVVGAALVGLLPAIKATGARVQAGLTRMASGGTNMQFGGVWSVIIVLQVALTVLCLPIGILSAEETFRDNRVRSAFEAKEFLTFRPELDREGVLSTVGELNDEQFRTRLVTVYAELSHRLESEPGVSVVTFAESLPGDHHPLRVIEAQRGAETPFAVRANTEGRVRTSSVDIDFFNAFRVPLLAGRQFHAGDIGAASGVVIINESLARNIGGNPLGVRVRFAARDDTEQPGPWYEVVGVVRNLGLDPTNRGDADFMFLPASPAEAYPPWVALRVNGDAAAFVPQLRTLAMRVEPGLRLYGLLTLDEVIRRRDLPMTQATFAGFGVLLLAIALSTAGLYALMSVAVARRTREIGIRLAIGASRRAVLSALFARARKQVGTGILIGNVLVAVALLRLAGYGLPDLPFLPMLGVSGLLALVGFLACLVPARRALRVQPTEALKQAG